MRKILLVTTLLSIAVSENILMENHPRLKTAWICDKQPWNRKIKRISRTDLSSKIEEALNYDDDKQFPRISDTRSINESRKLPSVAAIRRHELAQFDLSFDKSKLDNAKPKVLISIGIQEEKNGGRNLQEDSSTRKNYCNQGWQIQQPFYVDEPNWVDIDVDYTDSIHRMNNDPYILTRGKKIYRINDPDQVDKTIEATLNYPNKNKKLLIKSRVRRFAEVNEEFQDKIADEKDNRIKERNHYVSLQDTNKNTNNTAITEIENKGEKSFKIDKSSEDEKTKNTNYDVFNKKYVNVNLKNLAKKSSRKFKFTKQNEIYRNGKITNFVEQKQKIQRGDIPNDTETGSSKTVKIDHVERFNDSKSYFATNKNSVLLKNQEFPETRKKREIYGATSKKDVEQNETETYKEMKNKLYVNKLNNLGTPDNLFILSQSKDVINSGIKSLNMEDTDPDKLIERIWKFHYAYRKKLEESQEKAKNEGDKSEINGHGIEITDSQLINNNSKNSEIKISNYREKRNVCKNCKIKSEFLQDEWLKDIEKKIQLSLERRDKHRDILERLSLSEPYIISRGKKAPQDFRKDDLFWMSNSQNINEDRIKTISLPIAENLLRPLLMKMSRCNDDNCDINANPLSDERLSPRDRRGTLDEILATYDPYYVVRGKRMDRNQKSVLFKTDEKQ